MDPIVQWLIGPTMGAALVGLVWALATAIKRRSEGAAAQDEASAKAVVAVLAMVTDLRADLDREQVSRRALEQELRELRDDHEEEKSKRQHYESQVAILQSELAVERRERVAAEGWATALAKELAELRRALESGYTKVTLPPPGS
jgi:chromosome segregation ATPase